MKILTFDIGATFIKYAVCNENFVLTDRHTVPTEASKGGQELVNKIISIIESYNNIDRVAISTTGQVDSENGIVINSTDSIPYYTGMMMKKIVENKTGLPTYLENDVNAFALGEAKFGAGKNMSNFICLTYGGGIGGAMYIDNKLYKGTGSSAGEFGHMITHAGGKQCICGGEGCYECYASTEALLRAVNKGRDSKLDAFEIFEKDNFQKPEIRSAVDKWIDEIIIGLINIIYIFNPKLIILGGGIMNEDYVIDLIDRKIYNQLMMNFRTVNIVRSKLGNDAALLGVASQAAEL
ncbi:MAG: ROK family protein [Acetobacter sp.]|nr:ROK family protein [Bacteroides sp.]MCM1341430.1 ROK family protein [Acetobacter sp.]MCM1433384.1 ROK family protein [Clostridiales bacterium]